MKVASSEIMKYDPIHTFVTSDHHFRHWKRSFRFNCESTEEVEREHVELWNATVGKDDVVLYVGDFCDGNAADLVEVRKLLNGRITLIKGNRDLLPDELYRAAFEDVVDELRIDEMNLRLAHIRETVTDRRPGERIIYGHEHRGYVEPQPRPDSICVCARWHGWKPIALAEAIQMMDAAIPGRLEKHPGQIGKGPGRTEKSPGRQTQGGIPLCVKEVYPL